MNKNLIGMHAKPVLPSKEFATQPWDGGDGVKQPVDSKLLHWCKISANQELMQPREEETDQAAAGSRDTRVA